MTWTRPGRHWRKPLDGTRLLIDFLICDLDGDFDFLLGWNAIQHYGLQVDSQTGQLKGIGGDARFNLAIRPQGGYLDYSKLNRCYRPLIRPATTYTSY